MDKAFIVGGSGMKWNKKDYLFASVGIIGALCLLYGTVYLY